MRKIEATPESYVFKPEEILQKGEEMSNIHILNIMTVFPVLLGLSAITDKAFRRNRSLGTAIGLSSIALGLKITIYNINKQIPEGME